MKTAPLWLNVTIRRGSSVGVIQAPEKSGHNNKNKEVVRAEKMCEILIRKKTSAKKVRSSLYRSAKVIQPDLSLLRVHFKQKKKTQQKNRLPL